MGPWLEAMASTENRLKNAYRRVKGTCFKVYLLLHGCEVGKGIKCYSFPRFRSVPGCNIKIGNSVTFGYNCTIEVAAGGVLYIMDHCNITQNVLISCQKQIRIGSHVLIGENVSVRDADHGISRSQTVGSQPLVAKSVEIGNDVWIGAGALVLKGATIAEGAVIGGHSLVHQNSGIEPYGVYAGAPVRFLKWRTS